MAEMRQVREVSPIPPGRYWLVVLGPENQEDFAHWVRDMAGAVRIEASQLDTRRKPSTEFVVFNVPEGRAPFLNAAQFGFPTTAPPEVTTLQDVEQSPTVPGTLDNIEEGFKTIGRGVELGTAALVVLALMALSK